MSKRIVSLMLILLMALSFLLSCKEETDVITSSTTKEEKIPYLEKLGSRNFNNEEFVILDANDYPSMHINIPSDEGYTTDTINNAIYDRDKRIESLYNVKIKYVQITNAAKGITAFTNSFSAGEQEYDTIISTASGGRIDMLATNGYLADLCSIPTLDLKADWWSSLMYENIRLNDCMYFTTGDIAASVYDAPFAIFSNNKLLADYGVTADLFKVVSEGKWTLDYMASLVKDVSKDLDNDSIMNADVDLFSTICQGSRLTSNGWLVGAGYSMSDIENDNTIVVQGANDRMLSIIGKLKTIIVPATYNKPNDVIDKTFKDNRAVFLCHLMESAKMRLTDMDNNFSILPMPKYDENQKDYRSLVNGWVDCYIGVPGYVSDDAEYAKKVGFLLEAMAYSSYETVRPKVYDIVYKGRTVRDEGSARMLDIIYNSLYLDFNSLYNFGGSCDAISDHIFKGSELASVLDSKKSAIDAAVQKTADAWNNG